MQHLFYTLFSFPFYFKEKSGYSTKIGKRKSLEEGFLYNPSHGGGIPLKSISWTWKEKFSSDLGALLSPICPGFNFRHMQVVLFSLLPRFQFQTHTSLHLEMKGSTIDPTGAIPPFYIPRLFVYMCFHLCMDGLISTCKP